MTDLKQAVRPFVASLTGNRVLVRAGDLYRADDALVAAFPAKFRDPIILSSPAPRHPALKRAAPKKALPSKSK